jgi:transposase
MTERLSMRKIREVLRLRLECKRTQAEIAASAGIGPSTVGDYLARARKADVTWERARALGDAELEGLLFRDAGRNEPPARVAIDFGWVHRELSRPCVTLQTLWVEYREGALATGGTAKTYEYSRFCDLYAHWRKKLDVTMRQVHRAGEKLFIDYSGRRPHIVDRATGEVTEVELFVAVLGASNYTFAEATRTQQLADFVGSTVRAFEYFGCVPEVVVPDQLRSAVAGPDRYEPDNNPTYQEMAEHYGVTIIPARPRNPKDKPKVEGGVLIVQRWILAVLRGRTFFSLGELNATIAELLERLNARPFQKLEGCRRSAFETLDKPAMKPLPARRYEISSWKRAKVNIDYCVAYDHRIYSVPYALVGEQVDVRATVGTVEVLHRGVRVASHVRS